jgi:hypothetical protein
MKIPSYYLLVALLLTGTNVFPQPSGGGRATRSAAASTTQQPTTTLAVPHAATPQSSAPTINGPQYSPAQLEFGALWDGDSAKKTFSLITPAAGMVTLSFPGGGNFWLTEFREIAPIQGVSKNNPARQPGTLGAGGVKERTIYPVGTPVPPYIQWNLTAGSEIQLDIVFKPAYQPNGPNGGRNPAGLKSVTMKLSGPGPITQWSVSIPIRGTFNGPKKLDLSPQPPMSGPRNAATLSPTPSPPLSLPPASALIDNTPPHSPDQFEFGEVWDGDLAKKTLYLTTNASGYVTIQIPEGPFRVGEFREMGGVTGLKSKNNPKQQNSQVTAVQQIKSRIVYPDGKTGPFQWSMAPSVDMQVDIFFQPHFQFGGTMAGLKSQTMKVTGPGPKGNWALSLPLRGMFDGLKVAAPLVPDIKEIYAVGGDGKALLNVSLTGLGTPVQGTLKAGEKVPPGVSVVSRSVKVPAGQSVKTSVELSLAQFADDGIARPLELVFETSNGSSKTQVQFIGVPAAMIEVNSGDRSDCGVSRVSLSVSIAPPHQGPKSSEPARFSWVNKGWNLDLANRRYVWMAAESGGIRIFDRVLALYERKTDETWQSSGTVNPGGRMNSLQVSPEQWAQIVKGPFRFGCQVSDTLGPPKIQNPKWGPALKGPKI